MNQTTLRPHLCKYKKVPELATSDPTKNVNTTSEAKHTKVLGNEQVLKKDIMKNFSENTVEDDSENSKKKTERYFKYRQRNLWINAEQIVTVTKTLFLAFNF